MVGKHRAKKTGRLQTEAYTLLGAGAVALGLGAALTAGTGVAQADPNNAAVSGSGAGSSTGSGPGTTTIRTTVSAQSVNTSTHSTTPADNTEGGAPQDVGTSVVTTKDSVVREANSVPEFAGDNDEGPPPTLREALLGQADQNPEGLGIPGFDAAPNIPFIELGGGGGLLSKIAGALGHGLL